MAKSLRDGHADDLTGGCQGVLDCSRPGGLRALGRERDRELADAGLSKAVARGEAHRRLLMSESSGDPRLAIRRTRDDAFTRNQG